MERDVAAVVDVGARQRAAVDQRRQHVVGDGAGDGGHRRDEDVGMGPAGGGHALGHRAIRLGRDFGDRRTEQIELADQRREQPDEAGLGLAVRGAHLVGRAEGLDDQVDRAVLHMQPAPVGQQGDLGAAGHAVVRLVIRA